MRIAHVSDCYLPRLGGIERQVHDLATRQQQRGDDVTVVTAVAGASVPGTVPVLRPREAGRRLSTRIRYESTPAQLRALRSQRFDVVHIHASTLSPLAFTAARLCANAGIPSVLTLHSLLAEATPAYRALARLGRTRRWDVRWSAVSTVAAEQLRAAVGAHETVHVVPNGVEAADWTTERAAAPDGLIRIVSVGRLATRKRPRHLVRVLDHARRLTHPDVTLEAVMVGDGPQRGVVARAAARRGVDWLRLPGALPPDRIRALHARSHLYVAPATRESFGIAALEARCAGLPVIAHSGTGIRDFVRDGEHGLLVDDDDAMAEAIAHLAQHPDELGRLMNNVRAAPPAVTWADVMTAWDALYTGEPAIGQEPGRPDAAVVP